MNILQSLRRYLPRSSFIRGVLVLGGGSAISQGILIISAPLLTRLYSAEDFGIVAVFTSMLSILSVISSLRYELSIPIAKNDEEAIHGVALSLLISLVTSLIVFLVILGFREQITATLRIPPLKNFLWLLPPGLLLVSIYQIFYYWALRVKAFSAITRTKLTQSISSIVVKIGGSSFGAIALLLAQITEQSAGITSLGILTLRDRFDLFFTVRPETLKLIAWRYRQFSYFSTLGGLLNTTSIQLPPILFTFFLKPLLQDSIPYPIELYHYQCH